MRPVSESQIFLYNIKWLYMPIPYVKEAFKILLNIHHIRLISFIKKFILYNKFIYW